MSYSKEENEECNRELDRLIEKAELKVSGAEIRGPTLLSKIIIGIKKLGFKAKPGDKK